MGVNLEIRYPMPSDLAEHGFANIADVNEYVCMIMPMLPAWLPAKIMMTCPTVHCSSLHLTLLSALLLIGSSLIVSLTSMIIILH
jgi:hypothetical protein